MELIKLIENRIISLENTVLIVRSYPGEYRVIGQKEIENEIKHLKHLLSTTIIQNFKYFK